MKVAYIAAGAGGMYCGSCLRDNTLARELTRLGHPTTLVPTYTPLRTDEESVSSRRIFYGGIGVYLAQKFKFWRRPIPLLDRTLASSALLKILGSFSFSTKPRALGELAISVLRGEEGNQRKALEELLGFLEWEIQPDVVHLTNSLLSGLAGSMKQRLRVPLVCSFQGEDLFLEGLPREYKQRAIELIRKASENIDLYIAVSEYTAGYMAEYLGISRDRIHVVPPGIHLAGYRVRNPARRPPGRPFTVGYLARIAPEKGLAILCEAFRIFCQSLPSGGAGPAGKPRLLAAGYIDRTGREYLSVLERRMKGWGLSGRFEYLGEVNRAEKLSYLRMLDVLSVPATYPEAMGLYVYEALACGVPVVLPRSGAFPEILEATGGGLLVDAGDPGALAQGIQKLFLDPPLRCELGRRGAEAVWKNFPAEAMARKTLDLYGSLLVSGKLEGK